MAKVHGNIRKNDKSHDKQPDLRGAIKVGGWTGQRSDEKNRDAAQWLKNLASEFSERKETYINVAVWKRLDDETGQPYFSMTLEDNSWRSSNRGTGGGGSTSRPAPSKEAPSAPDPSPTSDESFGDIDF
mgnify:FL=1